VTSLETTLSRSRTPLEKINVKKLTSLKLSVRTTWWSQTSKTAKIFWGNPRWGSARRSLQADSITTKLPESHWSNK